MSPQSKAVAAPEALSTREIATASKLASRVLAPLDTGTRNAALEAMARALETATAELLAANQKDLRAAESLTGDEKLAPAILARLELSDARLREMIAQVRSVAALPDPLDRVLDAMELDDSDPAPAALDSKPAALDSKPAALDSKPAASDSTPEASDSTPSAKPTGLHLKKISVPLGVLAVIFEARPDAVTQIAALALKSGNAVILKPGREVERTAAALVHVLQAAVAQQGLPPAAIALVRGRECVDELLAMHDLIDMVIPRGGKSLVEYVQANTRIPVLGHAEGVCHIYVDRHADAELALRVIDDAKTDYPAVCNAVETVLVHREIAADFLPKLAERLRERDVTLHGDEATRELLLAALDIQLLAIHDWHTEYGDLAISIGVVDSLDAAINHIHAHGSSHTESILTEDAATAERFLREVDSAGVFHNVSTRFADGFRYGFGAEVGVSTSKFHARGPVGLEGLTTYKYVLRGHGHVAGDYRVSSKTGVTARTFTHRREV